MQEKDKRQEEQTDAPLPPRSTVHPSNRLQVIIWFYRILLALLFLLTGGLIVWGVQFLE